MSERIVNAYDAAAEDMCPNCVTPWKCNGPHLDLTVFTETHAASLSRLVDVPVFKPQP